MFPATHREVALQILLGNPGGKGKGEGMAAIGVHVGGELLSLQLINLENLGHFLLHSLRGNEIKEEGRNLETNLTSVIWSQLPFSSPAER